MLHDWRDEVDAKMPYPKTETSEPAPGSRVARMPWMRPFIDKDNDGKISSDEYWAFEDYKKKYTDWQNRARKKLGIDPPQDN